MSNHISEASESDIPALADLLVVSLGQTAMYDAMFLDDPDHANQKMIHEGRLKGMFMDPNSRVFKMVTTETDSSDGQGPGHRLVGCIALTFSDGEVEDGPLGPGTATVAGNAVRGFPLPPLLNRPAAEEILKGVARLLDGMRGKHYNVSLLGVHPDHRSRGLASRLLSHCIDIADQDKLGTWLCALPASHNLYHRLGFIDKEYEDANLDKVDPLNRHLGIFRHQAMYRPPPGGTVQ